MILTVTLYRRPQYTQQLFDNLRHCYGIEDTHTLISCDYSSDHAEACDKVIKLADEFANEHSAEIFVNDPRHGIDLNKLFILPKAFNLSEYVVFLEDDTQIAPDGLRFFAEMNHMFRDDPEVISVTGYNRIVDEPQFQHTLKEEAYHLGRGSGFTPWGWAMWKDRYEAIMGDGAAYAERWGAEVNGRFDWWFDHNINDLKRWTVYPVLPRTNHIGAEEAEHTPSAQYLVDNELSHYGAWSQEMPDPVHQIWTPLW